MNLQEAIKEANNRSRNANLQWIVSKWNDGYIIHSSSFLKRFPNTIFVYSTGPIDMIWDISYDKEEKRFKHIIKKQKK